MTPSSFAALAAGCAMVVMLLVELRVPFRPLRHWLARADHVEVDHLAGGDDDTGPWLVRSGVTGAELGERFDRLSLAAANLRWDHRLRAWAHGLVTCPWCSGGWVTAGALAGFSVARGADVLVFWPALWFAASSLVVAVRRLAD